MSDEFSVMANYVEYNARPDLPDVAMSNSVTSAFISVLAIATSRLAVSPTQKRLAVWLAGRDQSVLGLGCVGFDLTDLPWVIETFPEDREFLSSATTGALNQLGWDVLSYTPDTEVFFSTLEEFRSLLEHLDLADLLPGETDHAEPLAKCQNHGVYLHAGGCVVCNDV
jgi:hypothetical protein